LTPTACCGSIREKEYSVFDQRAALDLRETLRIQEEIKPPGSEGRFRFDKTVTIELLKALAKRAS
jgi:hypothetical protein